MMHNLIQLGLSISVLSNLFTIWQLHKALSSQSIHLNVLTQLVMAIAESSPNVKVVSEMVLPFGRNNP